MNERRMWNKYARNEHEGKLNTPVLSEILFDLFLAYFKYVYNAMN